MGANKNGIVNCQLTSVYYEGDATTKFTAIAKYNRHTGMVFDINDGVDQSDESTLDYRFITLPGDPGAEYILNADLSIKDNLMRRRAQSVTAFEILPSKSARHHIGVCSRNFLDYIIAGAAGTNVAHPCVLDARVRNVDTGEIVSVREMGTPDTIKNANDTLARAWALGEFLTDTDYQDPETWMDAIQDEESCPVEIEMLGIYVIDRYAHLHPSTLHEHIVAGYKAEKDTLRTSNNFRLPDVGGTNADDQEFNDMQLEVIQNYVDGEFSHIKTESALDGCGDTLLAFMVREVGDAGDDRDEAIRMLESARKQLDDVIDLLGNTPTPSPR